MLWQRLNCLALWALLIKFSEVGVNLELVALVFPEHPRVIDRNGGVPIFMGFLAFREALEIRNRDLIFSRTREVQRDGVG